MWDRVSVQFARLGKPAEFRMLPQLSRVLSWEGITLSVFLRLPSRDPLVCLATSITVRKTGAHAMTSVRSVLVSMLLPAQFLGPQLPQARTPRSHSPTQVPSIFYSPSTAPSFSNALLPLAFPSAQISAKTRKQDLPSPSQSKPLRCRCRPVLHIADPRHLCYLHLSKSLASACALRLSLISYLVIPIPVTRYAPGWPRRAHRDALC
ncbi:hypothetical protein EDB85DRAFT_1969216 [Lactarius pseudohatsudake]|nr:hypothetical protein EDB85DRAFT_1969216 [Lactarius pseudohatsudake]